MATNQERYRGEYVRDVMFANEFDGYFISAFMGVEKPAREYFELVISALQETDNKIRPENIIYFDDSQGHIRAAKELGMQAHVYESVEQVQQLL